ncbi:Y-family DNA polymerase [Nesterenkonia muleiensis]|uniref:Y-family DNA polymerase n=1 Tax=Nesterenkonia muleiensis TaxID=2282648 RepID=UPI000E7240EC|nr:Y-family DNA polymerase [Nesterenkonia muleiensis]
MTEKLVALIDVNSFYASCERAFDPALAARPVVVLSNNDGCAVAMSPEAKDLGVSVGMPWFKLAPTATQRGIIARSSNYELYGDMSHRFLQVIGEHSPQVEKYSIDEAFAAFDGPPSAAEPWSRKLRQEITDRLDLPVGIGVGPTKTLAKLANLAAKKVDGMHGVCVWDALPEDYREQVLSRLPVQQIWGVGPRTAKKLAAMGVETASQLRAADPLMVRKRLGVPVMRSLLELRGQPCVELTDARDFLDSLVFSRSFSSPVTTAETMEQVLVSYAQRACTRLNTRQSEAKTLTAWAMTSWHSNNSVFESPSATLSLPAPTNDPVILSRAAKSLLPKIKEGTRYTKAGITLTDLSPAGSQPTLDVLVDPQQESGLGPLLQRVREKAGTDSIGLGLGGLRIPAEWEMRREMMSPRYTTRWEEMLIVHAT